jgi:hypothetical protein
MIESTVVSEDEEADEEIDLDEIQDLLKPTIRFLE